MLNSSNTDGKKNIRSTEHKPWKKECFVSSSAIFPQTVSGDFVSFSVFVIWSLGRSECEIKLKAKTKSAIRHG